MHLLVNEFGTINLFIMIFGIETSAPPNLITINVSEKIIEAVANNKSGHIFVF